MNMSESLRPTAFDDTHTTWFSIARAWSSRSIVRRGSLPYLPPVQTEAAANRPLVEVRLGLLDRERRLGRGRHLGGAVGCRGGGAVPALLEEATAYAAVELGGVRARGSG